MRASPRHRGLDLLFIGLLPILLTFINGNWLFTPLPFKLDATTWLPDPWFYFSYFRHFFDLAVQYPSNTRYFVERLSWNLPGYAAYHVFPPLVANAVLHLGVYYIAVFSLYGLLCILFERKAALLTALMLGGYTWFLRAAGWDYTDGVGIAYFMLVLLCLTLAAFTRRPRAALFCAGAVSTLLVVSNVFWIALLSAAGIYYVWLNHTRQRRNVLIDILWAGSGAILIGVIFAVFYHSVTGDYYFLRSTLKFVQAEGGSWRSRDISLFAKIPPFQHLLPMLLALCAIPYLLAKSATRHSKSFIISAAFFVLCYGVFILANVTSAVLVVYFYSSFLIPATFLFLGAQVAVHIESYSIRAVLIMAAICLLILATPLLVFTLLPQLAVYEQNLTLVALCSLVFVIFLSWGRKRGRWQYTFLICVIAFSILGFLGNIQYPNQIFVADRNQRLNTFLAINDAIDVIDHHYSPADIGAVKLWYRGDENIDVNMAIVSVYMHPAIQPITPTFTWPTSFTAGDNNDIILLANGVSPLADAVAAAKTGLFSPGRYPYPFVTRGTDIQLVSAEPVQRGPVQFTIYLTRLIRGDTFFNLEFGRRFEFDVDPGSPNWYWPEKGPDGRTWIWSGPGTDSHLGVQVPGTNGDVRIQACILATLQPDIYQSLKVDINGIPIPLSHISIAPDCPMAVEGMVPKTLLTADKNLLMLTFHVNRTISPADLSQSGDPRKLGLAFNWIQFVYSKVDRGEIF